MAANSNSLALASASSQHADAADSASLSVTGSITLECYIKMSSAVPTNGYVWLITKWQDTVSNQRSYGLGLVDAAGTVSLRFVTSNNGTALDIDAQRTWAPSLNTWYHVAVVFTSGSKVQFYINGVQQGADVTTTSTAIFDGTAKLALGAINVDGTAREFLDGLIDEPRVWNVARTASQISTYYQSDVTGQTGLQAYWQLNNGYTDASGNSNTLTAVNTPSFSADVPFANYIVVSTGGVFGYSYFM